MIKFTVEATAAVGLFLTGAFIVYLKWKREKKAKKIIKPTKIVL